MHQRFTEWANIELLVLLKLICCVHFQTIDNDFCLFCCVYALFQNSIDKCVVVAMLCDTVFVVLLTLVVSEFLYYFRL